AVALSAFNAVTLTPALSALLLDRESHHKGRFFTFFERVISGGTSAYIRGLRRGIGWRWAIVVVFIATLGLTWWMVRIVPQSFVPEEDPGCFLTQIQAPAGASLEYTSDIARQAEQVILKDQDVLATFSVMGFSFSGASSNTGLMFVRLKPYAQRKGPDHVLQSVLRRVSGPLFSI